MIGVGDDEIAQVDHKAVARGDRALGVEPYEGVGDHHLGVIVAVVCDVLDGVGQHEDQRAVFLSHRRTRRSHEPRGKLVKLAVSAKVEFDEFVLPQDLLQNGQEARLDQAVVADLPVPEKRYLENLHHTLLIGLKSGIDSIIPFINYNFKSTPLKNSYFYLSVR